MHLAAVLSSGIEQRCRWPHEERTALATPLIPSGVPEPRPAEPAAKARRLVERAKAQVLARPNRAALFGAGAALVS